MNLCCLTKIQPKVRKCKSELDLRIEFLYIRSNGNPDSLASILHRSQGSFHDPVKMWTTNSRVATVVLSRMLVDDMASSRLNVCTLQDSG